MRLTYRERWLITAITIIVLAWASYVFGLRPAIERIETLNRIIPENERKLQDLMVKSKQYLALAATLENVKNNGTQDKTDFELVAFLESRCIDCGLAKKVVTMKQEVLPVDSNYSEIVAEIQLENITLQQLVEFLLKTESSNRLLWVKSLYIEKAYADSNLIGVVLQLSFFKLNPA
jgi:hypothetical protein